MTKPYGYRMPVNMMGQKHDNSEGKRGNNYGFWKSLVGDQGVDVDLIPVAKVKHVWTKASGVIIFCLHGRTPISNGYTHIMDGKHCIPMSRSELHRDIDDWSASEVDRWRRGPTSRHARPRSLGSCYKYLRAHGGTAIGELKFPYWVKYPWLHDILFEIAKQHNHSPLFKSLYNQAGIRTKAANFEAARKRAGAKGGGFAVIAGNHISGKKARQDKLASVTRSWPAELRAVTRRW